MGVCKMNTEKFTQGPWETVPFISWFGNPAIIIHNEDDGEIAIVNYHRGSDGITEKANTALISAAPDMFRLLRKQCYICMLKGHETECEFCEIHKVLKKARGKE
jgi:hypothetical protein